MATTQQQQQKILQTGRDNSCYVLNNRCYVFTGATYKYELDTFQSFTKVTTVEKVGIFWLKWYPTMVIFWGKKQPKQTLHAIPPLWGNIFFLNSCYHTLRFKGWLVHGSMAQGLLLSPGTVLCLVWYDIWYTVPNWHSVWWCHTC